MLKWAKSGWPVNGQWQVNSGTWNATLLYAEFNNGFDEFALNNNGRFTYSDQPGRDSQRSQAASLRGTFTGLAGARLTTVTSGSWSKSVYSYDDDWTAASEATYRF